MVSCYYTYKVLVCPCSSIGEIVMFSEIRRKQCICGKQLSIVVTLSSRITIPPDPSNYITGFNVKVPTDNYEIEKTVCAFSLTGKRSKRTIGRISNVFLFCLNCNTRNQVRTFIP